MKAYHLFSFSFFYLFTQAPTAFSQNLIKNGDCEEPAALLGIPSWTMSSGLTWRPLISPDFAAQSGRYMFFPGSSRNAELSQDVDVSDYACAIDAGRQRFIFTAYVRSLQQQSGVDETRVVVEYRRANNTILATYDSGTQTNSATWLQLTDTRLAPVNTRRIRIRLMSSRNVGSDNDGMYDNLSLVPNPALVKIDTIRTVATSCNPANGIARVSVSGGTAPFRFQINALATVTDSVFRNMASGTYTMTVRDANNCVAVSQNFNIGSLPIPAIQAIQSSFAICGRHNGRLTVNATGGIGGLSYKINAGSYRDSPRFDSLSAGVYLITIRDSMGCEATQNSSVQESARPRIDSIRLIAANCNRNNGSISVSASGAALPFGFSLDSVQFVSSPNFQNLTDGSFRLYIRDTNNCVVAQSVNVPRIAAPVFDTLIATAANCNRDNGSVQIMARNVSYSRDSLNFSGNRLFSHLRSGVYTFFIRDSQNCVVSKQAQIGLIPAPRITDVQTKPESCKRDDGLIVVFAESPMSRLMYSLDSTFSLRDSFTRLKSGIFTLRVRDSVGCIVSQNISLSQEKAPLILNIKTIPSVCEAPTGVVNISAKSSSDLEYSLDSLNFQKDYIFRSVKTGKYRVVVKDKKGCASVAEAVIERDCGIFVPNAFSPNGDGANDYFNFFGDPAKVDKVLTFSIFNRWGNLLYSNPDVKWNSQDGGWDGRLNGRDLETGLYVYLIRIQLKNGEIIDYKGDVTILR